MLSRPDVRGVCDEISPLDHPEETRPEAALSGKETQPLAENRPEAALSGNETRAR